MDYDERERSPKDYEFARGRTMNMQELLESAAKKVGGISELARQLAWDKGNIARIKAGKRPVPPYRAAQLAQVLERDEKAAYLAALAAQSDGAERKFWLGELKQRGGAMITMLTIIATLSLAGFQTQKTHDKGYSAEESGIYIMRHWIGRALFWLEQCWRQFSETLCHTMHGAAAATRIQSYG